MIRRNSYYFENDTIGSVIPDLNYPTSYSYTIMPGHDTKFDDTIPTDALGGNQPGIIPDLKQEAMTNQMRSDFRSIIEMLGGPEPTDGLPAQMQMDFRALTEAMGGGKSESETLAVIKESVEKLENSLSESQVQRLLEWVKVDYQAIAESNLKSEINDVQSKAELDKILKRIAEKPNPEGLLNTVRWAGMIIGVIGVAGAVGAPAIYQAVMNVLSAKGVWAVIKTCFHGLMTLFGVGMFSKISGTILEYLVVKSANLILHKDYATMYEKREAYKKLLLIIEANIFTAKRAGNDAKAKMFESMHERVHKELSKFDKIIN